MNKLIITAHPSTTGFTHKIAHKLVELSEKKWDICEIFDLYKTELRQDFLVYEQLSDIGNDITVKKIQEKITWADELIFIFPIWWWDAPAIMKNFLDCNFTTWFAFKYNESWKKIGLLWNKTARIIATSGAPWFFYKLLLHIQILWNLNRTWFCGINQKSFTILGNINKIRHNTQYIDNKIKSII